MNKKTLTMILIIFTLLIFTTNVKGYAQKGRQEEGIKLYVVAGTIVNSPGSVILVSELANGSSARGWEVAVIVEVQIETTTYLLQIIDSHIARDTSPRWAGSDVLQNNEGKTVGTAAFGPWLVYANGAPEWGDLQWDIIVSSLDGKEIYIHFVMVWGYGNEDPLSIIGDTLSAKEKEVSGQGAQFGYPHIALFGICSLVAFKHAHTKSIKTITAEEKPIREE